MGRVEYGWFDFSLCRSPSTETKKVWAHIDGAYLHVLMVDDTVEESFCSYLPESIEFFSRVMPFVDISVCVMKS